MKRNREGKLDEDRLLERLEVLRARLEEERRDEEKEQYDQPEVIELWGEADEAPNTSNNSRAYGCFVCTPPRLMTEDNGVWHPHFTSPLFKYLRVEEPVKTDKNLMHLHARVRVNNDQGVKTLINQTWNTSDENKENEDDIIQQYQEEEENEDDIIQQYQDNEMEDSEEEALIYVELSDSGSEIFIFDEEPSGSGLDVPTDSTNSTEASEDEEGSWEDKVMEKEGPWGPPPTPEEAEDDCSE